MDEMEIHEKEIKRHLEQIEYYLLCTNDEVINFVEMMLEGIVDRHFGGLTKWNDVYVCINCKEEFDKMPIKKNNECERGYYHDFVRKSDIMYGEERI